MNAAQYAQLSQGRKDWLIRHLWREGVGRSPHDTFLQMGRMVRIVGDGPAWWRVWLRAGDEYDVRRVRADPEWDFDALIRRD